VDTVARRAVALPVYAVCGAGGGGCHRKNTTSLRTAVLGAHAIANATSGGAHATHARGAVNRGGVFPLDDVRVAQTAERERHGDRLKKRGCVQTIEQIRV